MYRGFIKNITNLTGRALGSADLRIRNMTIRRDLLSKAESTFTVINVPSAAEVGNVFGVYDDSGAIVFEGVITGIDGTTIRCDQIYGLFDDDWRWNNPELNSIEESVASILQTDFQQSPDSMQADIWQQFDINVLTIAYTETSLPGREPNYVMNFMDFLFWLYERYDIIFFIDIPYSDERCTIDIGWHMNSHIKLSNNTNALRNFNVDREVAETNKLIIMDEKATTIRRTVYVTPFGKTQDSTSLNRLPKINTKYVFSDEDVDDIVANNLPTAMYNHKITCEMVLENKLYDFKEFELGRMFYIYYNDYYYESPLTGYEINVEENGKAEKVKLIFGKVRNSLDKHLYAERNKDNIQTSNHALSAATATSAESATYGNIPYGVCSTAGGTVAKAVTVNKSDFALVEGVQVAVKFTYANTIANPTLNVNDTGAKAIKRYGTTAPSTSAASSWQANSVLLLTYDGTYWMANNWLNTTYSQITQANISNSSSATTGLISGQRFKQGLDAYFVAGTYVYNGEATTSFSFTDSNITGKTRIVCSTQDAGNPVARASIAGDTITVYMVDPVTIMRVNYVCFGGN